MSTSYFTLLTLFTLGAAPGETRFIFPEFDQLSPRDRYLIKKDAYTRMRDDNTLEVVRMRFPSDKLSLVGFVYRPRTSPKTPPPLVLWMKGGFGEQAKIAADNVLPLYEMYRFAAAGFVVATMQYRGVDGSDGIDELGGADVKDVENLARAVRATAKTDEQKIFIYGISRGGLMTLSAMRSGLRVLAAAVCGPVVDWAEVIRRRPNERIAGVDTTSETAIAHRSPLRWAEKIDAPLLIFNGGSDAITPPSGALALAQKLEAAERLYELAIYAGDDHDVSGHLEERLDRTIDWFKNPRKIPIGASIERWWSENGKDAAIARYREVSRKEAHRYDLSERQLNILGYRMLFTGRLEEAIAIFKLNVEVFPRSSNAHDSLGEVYVASGKNELAIASYREALRLDPKNESARAALAKLERR